MPGEGTTNDRASTARKETGQKKHGFENRKTGRREGLPAKTVLTGPTVVTRAAGR